MQRIIVFCFLLFVFHASFAQQLFKSVVYFDFDKYTIDSIARNTLDSLTKEKIHFVLINGHCDSFGSQQYNDRLSLKRAKEVADFLIRKGASSSIISTNGFGKRQPLNQNENETARHLNRRVEIAFTLVNDIENKIEYISTDTTKINLQDAEIGSTIKLENINFYGGRHVLLPKSEKALSGLYNTLKDNPGLEIEIQGHICCLSGNVDGMDYDTRTWNLSVNRAKAIYDYLVEKGIKSSRLSYRGFGAKNKLVDENTEEDMSTNRRVEVKVINK